MVKQKLTSLLIPLLTTAISLATAVPGIAQQAGHPVAATRLPIKTPGTSAELQAERAKIWDSPDMLRARAWLKDYCSKSAKVTPEMAKQYETELANMTPNQMRLWLMKFDEQEQQRQQQWAMFQQYNAAGLKQAAAFHRQTKQEYANINQAESAAAKNAQQQQDEQREATQDIQEDRMFTAPGPYQYPYPYSYGPFGYGGIHYHYHLY